MQNDESSVEVEDNETLPTETSLTPAEEALRSINFERLKRVEAIAPTTTHAEPAPEKPAGAYKSYGDPSLEEQLTHLQAIEMLTRYELFFPEVYKKVMGNTLKESLNVVEANNAISKMKFLQSTKSMGQMNTWAARATLSGMEGLLCNLTPIDAEGLSTLADDPEFTDLWKEMTLDSTFLAYTKPHYRMGFLLLQNTLMLHRMNTARKEAEKRKRSIPTEKETEKEKETDEPLAKRARTH